MVVAWTVADTHLVTHNTRTTTIPLWTWVTEILAVAVAMVSVFVRRKKACMNAGRALIES